jgi:hypothetical protein
MLASLSTAAPPATSPDASALIARLARPAPATTAYTEVRFLHQLSRPLVLHGELEYDGPGRLGKRVDAPYREDTRIEGDTVEVTRAGRAPRHFALARAPELQVLLSGFSALLGGDAPTLEKVYTISVVENAANWTLALRPRDAASAQHLCELVVDGAAAEPRCFTLEQANGDHSVMLLGALAARPLPTTPTPVALTARCRSAP